MMQERERTIAGERTLSMWNAMHKYRGGSRKENQSHIQLQDRGQNIGGKEAGGPVAVVVAVQVLFSVRQEAKSSMGDQEMLEVEEKGKK